MLSKKRCIGCELCMNVCPVNAIDFLPDNLGFRYPHINVDKCIKCNKCETNCPILINNGDKRNTSVLNTLCGHFVNKNETLRSSSGGFATALAKSFIFQGGVVLGVSYSNDYSFAEYTLAITEKETERFRGSKYFQTRKHRLYDSIKKNLENQTRVLVIGLPCDIAAISSFFCNHIYRSNLYLCEIICHGITSEKVLNDYQKLISDQHPLPFSLFELRHKRDRWAPYYIYYKFNDGYESFDEYSTSEFRTAFFTMLRASCFKCGFKGSNSFADISIGDYWGISENDPAFQKEGNSLIIVRTEKGQNMVANIKGFDIFEADYQLALSCNPSIEKATLKTDYYESFIRHYLKRGLAYACSKRIIAEKRKKIAQKVKNHIYRVFGKRPIYEETN